MCYMSQGELAKIQVPVLRITRKLIYQNNFVLFLKTSTYYFADLSFHLRHMNARLSVLCGITYPTVFCTF